MVSDQVEKALDVQEGSAVAWELDRADQVSVVAVIPRLGPTNRSNLVAAH